MANCLFCKIIDRDIPATLVHEDDDLVAFEDINPQAPTHILIVPRRHIATLNDLTPDDHDLVGRMVRRAALIADYFGLAPAEGLLPDPRGFTGISPPGGRDAAVALGGFDRALFDVNLLTGRRMLEGDTLAFDATADSLGARIRLGETELATASFAGLIARAARSGISTAPGRVELPPDSLHLDFTQAGVTVRIQITTLRVRLTDDEHRPVSVRGTVLFRREEDPEP